MSTKNSHVRILECIGQHQPISINEINKITGINVHSISYHIRRMKAYVSKQGHHRYSLTERGEEAVKKIKQGQPIERILMPAKLPSEIRGMRLLEPDDLSIAKMFELPQLKFSEYRTTYDIITSVLLMGKRGFGITEAVERGGIAHNRMVGLIDRLEQKQLISLIKTSIGRKYWKTTEKGLIFLYLYSLVQELVK